jgi:hypothetical protein
MAGTHQSSETAEAGAGQTTAGPYLFALVTALDRQGQRGGVLGTGLADLARSEERFTKTVECLRLTRVIAGLAVEGQGLLEIADGLLATALPQFQNAQASQGPGLAQPAAGLPAQPQRPPEMGDRLQVMSLLQLEFAKVTQHMSLARSHTSFVEERQ